MSESEGEGKRRKRIYKKRGDEEGEISVILKGEESRRTETAQAEYCRGTEKTRVR